MKQMIPIPNYGLVEYLLILSPSKEVSQRIWSLKYPLFKQPGAELAKAAPHLTLISFVALPIWEEKIINLLRLIGMGIAPFTVELKDFIAFEQSYSICIDVVSKNEVRYLLRELKQAKSLLSTNRSYPPIFVSNPHITICRGLLPEQYQTFSVNYSTQQFSDNFTASSMTLLKRPLGEFKCSTVSEFAFQNNPRLPKQGSLFM